MHFTGDTVRVLSDQLLPGRDSAGLRWRWDQLQTQEGEGGSYQEYRGRSGGTLEVMLVLSGISVYAAVTT